MQTLEELMTFLAESQGSIAFIRREKEELDWGDSPRFTLVCRIWVRHCGQEYTYEFIADRPTETTRQLIEAGRKLRYRIAGVY